MKEFAQKLEAYETPPWVIPKILDVELMTRRVLDPCTGRFVLADEASKRGHDVTTIDVHQWVETRAPDYITSFLDYYDDLSETTVFMNPPFSLACDFIDHARLLNVRKIICFQRFAWREGSRDAGKMRGQWWEDNPPARIWLCGDRATCHRFDLFEPTNPDRLKGNSPTAHAFFIWERGHRSAEIIRGLYK